MHYPLKILLEKVCLINNVLWEIHCFDLNSKTHLLLTSFGKISHYFLLELSSASCSINLGSLSSQMAEQMLDQQWLWVTHTHAHTHTHSLLLPFAASDPASSLPSHRPCFSPSLHVPPSHARAPRTAAAWCALERPPAWGPSGPGWRRVAGSEGAESRVGTGNPAPWRSASGSPP